MCYVPLEEASTPAGRYHASRRIENSSSAGGDGAQQAGRTTTHDLRPLGIELGLLGAVAALCAFLYVALRVRPGLSCLCNDVPCYSSSS